MTFSTKFPVIVMDLHYTAYFLPQLTFQLSLSFLIYKMEDIISKYLS